LNLLQKKHCCKLAGQNIKFLCGLPPHLNRAFLIAPRDSALRLIGGAVDIVAVAEILLVVRN